MCGISLVCYFSLAAFNILSLCLVFVSLISMCLVCFSLGLSSMGGTLCASWTWLIIFFSMLGSTIISSKIFSYPFFFLFFFGDPYNSNVSVFDIVSEVSDTNLDSFHSFYFILLFRSYFHHFIFQLTASIFCLIYSAINSF